MGPPQAIGSRRSARIWAAFIDLVSGTGASKSEVVARDPQLWRLMHSSVLTSARRTRVTMPTSIVARACAPGAPRPLSDRVICSLEPAVAPSAACQKQRSSGQTAATSSYRLQLSQLAVAIIARVLARRAKRGECTLELQFSRLQPSPFRMLSK